LLPSLRLKGWGGNIVFKQLKALWSKITTDWQHNFNKFCFFLALRFIKSWLEAIEGR
jgi:hypothetical protein